MSTSSTSSSPSVKQQQQQQQYEPVVQHHDDDDDKHIVASTITNDSDDFLNIQMQTSSDDSDAKTEPMSNLRSSTHLSFDLEEEESELSRYRLDSNLHSSSSFSQHINSTTSDVPFSKKLSLSTLWHYYLETRLQHRRRRAELLLSMNEDSLVERLQFCVTTWTDIFDTKGLVLHITVFIIWLVWCHVHPSKTLVVGGIVCILARILWKPCFWLLYEKRQEAKRQETMAIYDELNGSWDHHHSESHDNEDDEEEAVLENIV